MRNINSTLIDGTRTSVFIAHRLRTISDAGEYPSEKMQNGSANQTLIRRDHCAQGWHCCRAGLT